MPPQSATTTTTTVTQRHNSYTADDNEAILNGYLNQKEESNDDGSLRMKINGKWLLLKPEFVKRHPGGEVINQYRDADATEIFNAFHEGSSTAFKELKLIEQTSVVEGPKELHTNGILSDGTSTDTNIDTNNNEKQPVASYELSLEAEKKIVRDFERLREQIYTKEGLMESRPWFFVRKIVEVTAMLLIAFMLQYYTYYVASACVLALCWQQLGWLTHEFCHHQPTKNRRFNDSLSLVLGNVAQGYSRDWWKDKHNLHHAATNILERDGDIDLAPLIALVPSDLLKYRASVERFLLRLIPYQHFYYAALFVVLRLSWSSQSILHVLNSPQSEFVKHRKHVKVERIGLLLHWSWVLLQLWLLPTFGTRVLYFAISQLGAGLLIAMVVSYNHNSTPKYAENSRVLNNFAALQILTTRNMCPSPFVDWLWGGLNYQIEHHLFPTMPRPNLNRCSKLVREFCAENDLPYQVDDFFTGHGESIRLLRETARAALALPCIHEKAS